MKEINELLRDKEHDLARVRHEVDSLRLVASLLSEEITEEFAKKPGSPEKMSDVRPELEATGTDTLFSSVPDSRPAFWNAFRWRK